MPSFKKIMDRSILSFAISSIVNHFQKKNSTIIDCLIVVCKNWKFMARYRVKTMFVVKTITTLPFYRLRAILLLNPFLHSMERNKVDCCLLNIDRC
jgi:hypothetical protein